MGKVFTHFPKPARRFVEECIYGIQASGDTKLSSIVRTIDDDIRPIYAEKRLSRNLGAPTLEDARRRLSELVSRYSKSQSRLAAWMEDNVPEGLTVFCFPQDVRAFLRTNNISENLNKQIKARTRLIPAFPNTDSLMRLVSAICAEVSDEWECSSNKYMSTISKL